MMLGVTVKGTEYFVDQATLRACTAAFDVWRDGLGKFSGPMGRQAFLRGTSDIVGRVVAEDAGDPWLRDRVLRVMRHTLASRPRKAKTSGCTSDGNVV